MYVRLDSDLENKEFCDYIFGSILVVRSRFYHYKQHFEPFFGLKRMRLTGGHYEHFAFLAI